MSNHTFNQLVAEAQADVDAGRPPDYSKLFDDAVADVESGVKHACGTTEHCQEMGGCPRCFQGLMKGDLGVLSVDVFKSGVIRVTTVGHGGQPCTVSFRNVPVNIHQKEDHHAIPNRESMPSHSRRELHAGVSNLP